MERASSLEFPPAETVLCTVSECIQELTIMQQGILKLNYSLVQGETRDKVQEEVLSNKSNVLRRIQRLFNETEEADDEGSSSCFCPTTVIAVTTISECIDNLFSINNSIYEMQRPGFESKASYKGQDIHFFKAKVVGYVRMLFKETKESNDESMEESDDESVEESDDECSSTYFPHKKTAFDTITNCIRELAILNRKVSLEQVVEQNMIHALIYKAMCHIQMLFNKDNRYHRPKGHSSKKDVASGNISKCIEELCRMLVVVETNASVFQGKSVESLDMKQKKVLDIKSQVVRRIEEMLFEEMLFEGTVEEDEDMDEAVSAAARESSPLLPLSVSELVDAIKSARWFKTEEFSWSGDDGKKETKGRYICVSNGYEIWCLDLKHYSQTDKSGGPVALPKIASLNLLEGKLPASVGLFNLGTDACVIGGQMLSDPVEVDDFKKTYCKHRWGENPQGIELYKSRCYLHGIKGSSCVTYRLSLNAGDGTLSYSEASDIIEELKTPKVWPIVENIGGELHVMDSIPPRLSDRQDIWACSHEVCHKVERSKWKEIQTCMKEKKKEQLMSHVVVGNRIYGSTEKRHVVFDSQMEKWEGCKRMKYLGPFNVEQVGHILYCGITRCVGEIPHPCGERLFVLVALVRHCHRSLICVMGIKAVAYVVTLTGRVVCYQLLPDFFEEGPFQPCDMTAGTMIQVDPDEAGTLCSVVSGTMLPDGGRREYMFINTFSVEIADDAGDMVERLLEKKASKQVVQAEFNFVRIVSNDRSVYHLDAEMKTVLPYHDRWVVGWRACFVNPSQS